MTARERWFPGLALLAVLPLLWQASLGCPAAPGEENPTYADDDDDVGDDDTAGDDDTGDDDTSQDIGPCGDGEWGQIPQIGTVLLVDDDAGEGGDGSLDFPYQTIAEAVEAARDIGDAVVIGLAPGEYTENVALSTVSGQWSDDRLTLAGCSVAEVKLLADDPLAPTISVRSADEVTLRAFTVQGGDPGIVIADAAGETAPVRLEGLEVLQASRAGVVVDDQGGGDTQAILSGVVVADPEPVDGAYGWGIAVQHAAATITGGSVSGATQVGVFGHLAEIQLDGIDISGVAADASGALGRGVHLQLLSSGMVRNSTIDGCSDSGIYVHTGLGVTLEDNLVKNTVPAAIPGSKEQSGDGIVVTMGDEGFEPSLFPAYLLGNTSETNGRSGIVLDGVWAELVGNSAPDNVFDPGGWGIVTQNAAIVEVGGDDYLDLDTAVDQEPVELNIAELNWIPVASD